MPNQWDLTGENIENTYQRVLQTPDGVNIFDGTGSLFYLGVFNNTSTGSFGSFYDTGSQTAVSATAIYSMSLSTTDISNGVYVDPTDRTKIYVNNPGVYNIQFSAQFSNSGNDPTDVSIWIRKNDMSSANDVADSSGICTIPAKKGSTPGQLITSWNYYITLAANDFVQFLWNAHDPNVITLETIAASTNPVHPRTPSLIVTAQRVDTFFSNTGSFSGSFIGTHTGSFTGSFTGSLLGTASWADSASQALTASFYQETDPIFIAKSASLATTGSNIFVGNQVVSGSFIIDTASSDAALRVTQTGTGDAILVEDSANPDSTPFVVAADGRVGIGVQAPLSTYKLHVRNGAVTNSTTWGGSVGVFENSASNAYLSVLASNTYTAGIGFGTADHRVSADLNWNSTTKGFNLATNTASAFLTFGTDTGTERMRITSGGLVGIGTTTPQYLLDVSGSTRIAGSLIVTGSISSLNTTASQETFSSTTYVSGDIIQGTVVGVSQYELAYLNINGTWQHVDQTSDTSTKMLGIYLGGDQILIDGNISATTAGVGSPIGVDIMNPDQGLPVYIDSGSSYDFNTIIPTSNYIRTLGYVYYNNTINIDNWILKFRPSTDWYKI